MTWKSFKSCELGYWVYKLIRRSHVHPQFALKQMENQRSNGTISKLKKNQVNNKNNNINETLLFPKIRNSSRQLNTLKISQSLLERVNEFLKIVLCFDEGFIYTYESAWFCCTKVCYLDNEFAAKKFFHCLCRTFVEFIFPMYHCRQDRLRHLRWVHILLQIYFCVEVFKATQNFVKD